jgi:hypothetical protein
VRSLTSKQPFGAALDHDLGIVEQVVELHHPDQSRGKRHRFGVEVPFPEQHGACELMTL